MVAIYNNKGEKLSQNVVHQSDKILVIENKKWKLKIRKNVYYILNFKKQNCKTANSRWFKISQA